MKRSGRSNLGKTLERGEKLVIHVPFEGAMNGRVLHQRGGGRVVCRYERKQRSVAGKTWHSVHTYTVRRRDEGITWARGWDGEVADALRVAVALA